MTRKTLESPKVPDSKNGGDKIIFRYNK